jgi:hypothetical protein
MIRLKTTKMYRLRRWWDRNPVPARPSDDVVEIAYLERGGALVTPRGVPAGALFDLSEIYLTEAAIQTLGKTGKYAWPLLLQHVQGDWESGGRMEEATQSSGKGVRMIPSASGWAARNSSAIRTMEGRVVSEYGTSRPGRVGVITHLGEGGYTSFVMPGDT